MNFYNEFDPAAAAWLRELIAVGAIPPGVVDERSISDLQPSDLHGYTQCHFFAGIGGWNLALELAGVDSTRPLWTGSCPCQPYSAAGKGLGDSDPRNLWPAFFRLIRECRPQLVFGEQVADAIGKGWLDRVSADLEGEGYACGAAVLGAHSVGAPHIRKRLYWVADADRFGQAQRGTSRCGYENQRDGSGNHGSFRRMADGIGEGLEGHRRDERDGSEPGRLDPLAAGSTAAGGDVGWMADAERDDRQADQPERGQEGRAVDRRACGGSEPGGMGDSDSGRLCECGERDGGPVGCELEASRGADAGRSNPWSDSYWLLCRDGKHRRVPTEPALFPLADGLPYKLARRGSVRPALLKGAGNAIVPQVAAEFIGAYLDTLKP